MPYKVGKKTKTKGWPILKFENGKWGLLLIRVARLKQKQAFAPGMRRQEEKVKK